MSTWQWGSLDITDRLNTIKNFIKLHHQFSSIMHYGGCIYILTNKSKTTLYIGVTSDLKNRIYQHKSNHYPSSFSAKYHLNICVYYEAFLRIEEAIAREKQLKKWNRNKKEMLIQKLNPAWNDLWDQIKDW